MGTFDSAKDSRARSYIESGDRSRVFEKEGKWFMRPFATGPSAEIPENVARVVRTGLRISRMFPADPYGADKPSDSIWRGINCHRAALYAIGLINRDDPENGTALHPYYEYPFFPLDDFSHFTSLDQLTGFLREKIGSELGLVQIVGYVNTEKKEVGYKGDKGFLPKLAHTLIAKFDNEGGVVCFEKVNMGPTFHVVTLREVFERGYGVKGYWAAEKVDLLKDSNAAKLMREELDKQKFSN